MRSLTAKSHTITSQVYSYDPRINLQKEKEQNTDLPPLKRSYKKVDDGAGEMFKGLQTATRLVENDHYDSSFHVFSLLKWDGPF